MRRTVAIGCTVSFCAFAIYLLCARQPRPPIGGMGSDHLSHAASTILFWRHGFAIWSQPSGAICDELCPLVNWPAFPRHYPPGLFLYSLPEALLLANGVSVDAVGRAALIKHVAAAHLLIALLLWFVLTGPRPRWLLALVPLAALAAIEWAMCGFYDALPVALALLGVRAFGERRDGDCLLWLALGFFLAFRVAWYAPLAAVALARSPLRSWRVALALLLAALAAVPFVFLLSSMQRLPADRWLQWPVALSSLAALALLASARDWAVAATLAWQLLVVACTSQQQTWHALSLVPLLALADRARLRGRALTGVTLSLTAQLRLIFFHWL